MAKLVAVFVLIVFVAASYGVPVDRVLGNGIEGHAAKIIEEHFDTDGNGNYNFGYKQDDLQERQEAGTVAINPETGNSTLDNVIGSYRYVRPDGLWQIVEYRADTNGFVAHPRTEPYIQ
ncbi:endocuticle structural protein SgAbd-6-like [Chironomus tepperi]|uniref:endocuticle structural protein SgAbd-6-like n=1 Tax=Chironomus tepperi TaxID=113505 RepID=UPI00391F690B